jgi:hypothetical protein
MKNYQLKLMSCVFVAFMVMVFSSISIVHAQEEMMEDVSARIGHVSYEHAALKPHFDFYYLLLAEKYAPKYVKVWKEVVKEREDLLSKSKELISEGKEIGDYYDEDWSNTHSEIQKKFLEAVEKQAEDSLKEIVPRVIEHQKELNTLLKKHLKEIK